jgi:hypothetical protein
VATSACQIKDAGLGMNGIPGLGHAGYWRGCGRAELLPWRMRVIRSWAAGFNKHFGTADVIPGPHPHPQIVSP